jgi:methylated-DNA-[protein]-cysteine S-methyltransferase
MEIRQVNASVHFDFIDSPMGRLRLTATNAGLTGVHFEDERYAPPLEPAWIRAPALPLLREASIQLAEYFAGRRRAFDLPLAPAGTPFQRAVWGAIATVRPGETISYAELARRAGRPRSVRAAGGATGRNPLAIVIPCHRIVGADGSLTGYGGGLARKRALLALERDARSARPAA